MGDFRLGKYQLLAELARGGMGIVYLAVSHGPGGFNKLLIIKELKSEFVNDPTFLAMFLEEARLAARLTHPNIVQTLEVGQEGSRHFIAMEYLEGQPLSRVRQRHPDGFTLGAELRLMVDTLRGLHHAHTLTNYDGSPALIVHRDVSPQNIFVTYDGIAKILDFGIAKAADTMHETQAGMFKGKAAYIAPEQLMGSKLDPRTDVFAAGIMLWEAVAGRRLWAGLKEVEILKRLVRKEIPEIRSIKPDVDEEIVRILGRAMAWKVDDRYASADAMGRDIEEYLAALPRSSRAPSQQAVGDSIRGAFRTEREQLRAIVEPQLAALQRESVQGDGDTLPRFGGADGPDTGQSGRLVAVAPISKAAPKKVAPSAAPAATRSTRRRPALWPWVAVGLASVPILLAVSSGRSSVPVEAVPAARPPMPLVEAGPSAPVATQANVAAPAAPHESDNATSIAALAVSSALPASSSNPSPATTLSVATSPNNAAATPPSEGADPPRTPSNGAP